MGDKNTYSALREQLKNEYSLLDLSSKTREFIKSFHKDHRFCDTEIKQSYTEFDENTATENSFDVTTPILKASIYSSNSSAETSVKGVIKKGKKKTSR